MNPSVDSTRFRRSWLELELRGRAILASSYLVAMALTVASSPLRPDRVFGFQMFNEASTMEIHLTRRVRGERKPIPLVDGAWQARDQRGRLHTFRWQDRVKDAVLGTLDRRVNARYGLEGQLYRLKSAMRDVLAHIPADTETTELLATVFTLKNGHTSARERLRVKR